MVAFFNLIAAFSAISASFAIPSPTLPKRSPMDFVLRRNESSLLRRATPNYKQDYTTGGDVVYTPSGSSFTVDWDTQDDFVVGLGWTTGSNNPINFSGTFGIGSGTALLSIYGWSENPLVEYYIVEDNSSPPSFGTVKGSVTSDGSSYTIWENQRVNEPSIVGTATFNQYISVRSSPRKSGTVTVENHFKAWAALGMKLGTLNYQVLAVEGWGGEGAATQTVS
ncbi:6c63236e-7929-451c-91c7-58f1ad43d71f [Sclerotinia trifoliorum]|uniref:Endo-1,4-beta-xylanase n=1 Tax=Sclerotinia trifoliorum TaxID=28548 RepID=A0A8H2ZSD8_9HELO|nr:6c63236e-7929-451c-91c7-58f1ad43d71f [Sclerotinia trifoliorum]